MRRGNSGFGGRGNGGFGVVGGHSDAGDEFRVALVRFAVPWVLLLLLLPVGAVAHAAWSTAPALPWITAVFALAVAGLSCLAWVVTSRNRLGPVGRAHAAVTVAVVGAWLLLAVVVGPWTRGVIDAWGLGGFVLAISWSLRLALHRPPRKEDGEETGSMSPARAGRVLMTSLGMRGDGLVVDEVSPHRIGGRLALTSGEHTVDDAQKRSHQVAAALGIPKSGVRFTENPQDASAPEFSFTLRDVLGESVPWPGPSHIGGTPFDPIPMGLYETGAVMTKKVIDGSGAKHELIQGMSGAGKSAGAKVEICEHMTRRETALIVIDTVKGIQGFGPAAPGLSLFLTDEKRAAKFMHRLPAVIKGRAGYLGAHGLSEWAPGCGLSYLVVQIEEAGNLIAAIGDDNLTLVVKAARSAGMSIKVSLQRPSYDEISTTARGQLGTVTCYGMANDDPVCLLPEAVQDAGADPRQWGDRQPGCCYVAGTGISIGQAATPLRNYEIPNARFAAHAAEWGPRMDPIDTITTGLLGELWTRRIPPVQLVEQTRAAALRGAGQVVDGQVIRFRPADAGQDTDRDADPDDRAGADRWDGRDDLADDLDDDEIDDDAADPTTVTPQDMGIEPDPDDDGTTPDLDEDVESVADDADFRFGPAPAAPVSVEQARAAVAARLVEVEAEGRDTVSVPDLADLVTSGMRSRAWFRKELIRLCKLGRLAEQDEAGVFLIVPLDEDDDQDDDQDENGEDAA